MSLKKSLKSILRAVCGFLVRKWSLPKLIIVNMDGGICSQMHFYACGTLLNQYGDVVAYNLDWFDKHGLDIDGRFERNYDLQKLFPSLEVPKIVNPLLKWIYRTCFWTETDYFGDSGSGDWKGIKAPAYVSGYFYETDDIFSKLFPVLFSDPGPQLDMETESILEDIKDAETTCAVHVRRGDLAKAVPPYGTPATPGYFAEAVKLVHKKNPNTLFLFFSDEPNWIEKEILPLLPDADFKVCHAHGSDKGYLDLYLMSQCRNIITSQGSMGKYAALMRCADNQDGLVCLRKGEESDIWARRFRNPVIL